MSFSDQRFSDLVPRYPNLMVSRTFSFAYGRAFYTGRTYPILGCSFSSTS